MKKITQFLLGLSVLSFLAITCKGPLPNASITGATFWDYVPYGMMILGGLFLGYITIDFAVNFKAYADKVKTNSTQWFVFGVGGLVLLIMGFAIYAS